MFLPQADDMGEPILLAFGCAICAEKFPTKMAVAGHMRTHNPVKCHICDVVMDNLGHYNYHRAVFHAPKYQCKICKFEDGNPDSLVVHILEHEQVARERQAVYQHFDRN